MPRDSGPVPGSPYAWGSAESSVCISRSERTWHHERAPRLEAYWTRPSVNLALASRRHESAPTWHVWFDRHASHSDLLDRATNNSASTRWVALTAGNGGVAMGLTGPSRHGITRDTAWRRHSERVGPCPAKPLLRETHARGCVASAE